MHLLDPSRPPLGEQWVITGDITAEGKLQAVNGYLAKLHATCHGGYKIIVPLADLGRLRTLRTWRPRQLEGASTVERASEIASRLVDTAPERFAGREHLCRSARQNPDSNRGVSGLLRSR